MYICIRIYITVYIYIIYVCVSEEVGKKKRTKFSYFFEEPKNFFKPCLRGNDCVSNSEIFDNESMFQCLQRRREFANPGKVAGYCSQGSTFSSLFFFFLFCKKKNKQKKEVNLLISGLRFSTHVDVCDRERLINYSVFFGSRKNT